ncbi:MAG: hypothetical protein ACOYB3_01455 [Azonexus sp.]
MTRTSAKSIALGIVTTWWKMNFPVSGSLNGFRVMGTRTGRMRGSVRSLSEVNRNGDAFAPGLVLDLSNHPELVAMRRELEAAWRRPDMLVGRDQADALYAALQSYAIEHDIAVMTAQQQPVLRDSE